MISQNFSKLELNFAIFPCLTLPWSSKKVRHDCSVIMETIKILFINFLLVMYKGPRSNHAKFGLYQVYALREKYPYLEFSWSIFSSSRTEYGPKKLQIRSLFRQWLSLSYSWLTEKLSHFVPGYTKSDWRVFFQSLMLS